MQEPADPRFYRELLDSLIEAVCFVDLDCRISYWNRAAEKLTGYSSSEVLGRECSDELMVHTDEDGRPMCRTPSCPAMQSMSMGCSRERYAYLRHKSGHRLPVLSRVSPVFGDDDTVIGAVELFSDASKLKEDQERVAALETAALLDPVTNIANRRYAETVLGDRLGTFERYGLPFGVLFADIDHFKEVNDQHGHEVGDGVLRMVAATLRHGVRESDFVARWGGEEFLVIITGCSAESLLASGEKLRRLVESSAFQAPGERVEVTLSIGAALVPPVATRGIDLVSRADVMMYEAKRAGRNLVRLESKPEESLRRSSA